MHRNRPGLGGMLSKSAVLEYATEPRLRPLLILEPKSVLGPIGADIGMGFETGLMPQHGIASPGPYAVVRWCDRWGQRWEHNQGTVRKIEEVEPWLA